MGRITFTSTFEDGEINSVTGDIDDPIILEAYWSDGKGNPITVLDYNKQAHINVKSKNIINEKITLRVYENDPFDDDHIYTTKYTTEYDEFVMSFDVTPNMFVKGEEDLVHFYFSLQIEDQDKVEFCNSNSKYLKIHLVRYVPSVMKTLGWNKGAALQEEWFRRKPTKNIDENPDFSIITMDWVLGFTVPNNIYNLMITEKIWINTDGKIALLAEINKMVTDGEIIIPTIEGTSVNFGVFEKTLTPHKNIKVPKFDKYHYQERKYDVLGIFRPLDDLTAALARFVFRMCSGGTITKNKDNYTILINKVAIYLRDSFDFIDPGWSSQNLGYWNIKKNKVWKTNIQTTPEYRLIENSSYQDYAKEFKMGGDFRLYSDLKYTDTNDTFEIPLNTF